MGRIQKRVLAERRRRDVCFLLSDNAVAVVIGILGVLAMALVGSFQWRDSSWAMGMDGPLGSGWALCTATLVSEEVLRESKAEPHILVRTTTTPSFWISLLPENRDPLGFDIAVTGQLHDEMLTRIVETYLQHWSGRVVVDVGSTSGWLSAYSAKLGYKSYVFGTDPFLLVKLCQTKSANRLDELMVIVDVDVRNDGNETGAEKRGESLDGYFRNKGCEAEKVSLLNVVGDGVFSEGLVMNGAWEFIERCDVQLIYLGMASGMSPVKFPEMCQKMMQIGFQVYGIAEYTEGGQMAYYSNLSESQRDPKQVEKACGDYCNVLWVKTERSDSLQGE